jgi:hypothetical protein
MAKSTSRKFPVKIGTLLAACEFQGEWRCKEFCKGRRLVTEINPEE